MTDPVKDISEKACPRLCFYVILFIVIVISPTLGSFFSEDDFAGLFVDADTPAEFGEFFKPEPGSERPWYRPVSFQIRFWLMHEAFGFNPTPFRLLTLILHCANILLCFSLLHWLTGRNDAATLGAILYGLNGAHQMSLFWFAAGNEMVAALFLLCGILAFLWWRIKPNIGRGVVTGLAFIMLLLSKETGVMFPFMVLLTDRIFPLKGKRNWGMHIALFIVLAIYLIFWFTQQYQPGGGEGEGYGLDLAPGPIIMNFITFLGQAFIGSSILYSIATAFGGDAGPSGYKEFFTPLNVSIALVVFAAIIAVSARSVRNGWKKMPEEYRKLTVWGAVWFILGLLPVLPLTGHNYAYYMNIALIGLGGIFTALWSGFSHSAENHKPWKIAGWILAGLYLFNFSVNVHLASVVRTIPRHSEVAQTAFEAMIAQKIEFEDGTLLFILDVDDDVKTAVAHGLMYRAMYPEKLRYAFMLPKGSTVDMEYLEKNGWTDDAPKVFLTYDGEEYSSVGQAYLISNYFTEYQPSRD